MEHAFWHEKWEQNQIGFHQPEINRHLRQYWQDLGLAVGSRVLVPLCGKTQDMLWLREQGYQVIGVELSPLAVEAFFAENHLQPQFRQCGDFSISEVEGLQLWCGDFFALPPEELGKIDGVYDRAALVALPETMRGRYVEKMAQLLKPAAKLLLVSFDYEQQEMAGPPFSVAAPEIDRLYSTWCERELLLEMDVLEQQPHLKSRGLTRLQEQVYRLTVK